MSKINGNGFLFRSIRFLYRSYFSIFCRAEIIGLENVPQTGGVIIAPNHISLADPPLAACYLKRPLFFMAKKELFDIFLLGKVIKMTNAFPVDRTKQDIVAFRNAINVLKCGNALLIFPEGTRSKDGLIGNARLGISMIAASANVAVVPVRIINSEKALRFKKIKIIFGAPIAPPLIGTRETYRIFADKIIEEIKKL